jgi:hypothetical protein
MFKKQTTRRPAISDESLEITLQLCIGSSLELGIPKSKIHNVLSKRL